MRAACSAESDCAAGFTRRLGKALAVKLGPFFALLSMHQGEGHPMPPPGKLGLAGPGATMLRMHQASLQSKCGSPYGHSGPSYASSAETWHACQAAGGFFEPKPNPDPNPGPDH